MINVAGHRFHHPLLGDVIVLGTLFCSMPKGSVFYGNVVMKVWPSRSGRRKIRFLRGNQVLSIWPYIGWADIDTTRFLTRTGRGLPAAAEAAWVVANLAETFPHFSPLVQFFGEGAINDDNKVAPSVRYWARRSGPGGRWLYGKNEAALATQVGKNCAIFDTPTFIGTEVTTFDRVGTSGYHGAIEWKNGPPTQARFVATCQERSRGADDPLYAAKKARPYNGFIGVGLIYERPEFDYYGNITTALSWGTIKYRRDGLITIHFAPSYSAIPSAEEAAGVGGSEKPEAPIPGLDVPSATIAGLDVPSGATEEAAPNPTIAGLEIPFVEEGERFF